MSSAEPSSASAHGLAAICCSRLTLHAGGQPVFLPTKINGPKASAHPQVCGHHIRACRPTFVAFWQCSFTSLQLSATQRPALQSGLKRSARQPRGHMLWSVTECSESATAGKKILADCWRNGVQLEVQIVEFEWSISWHRGFQSPATWSIVLAIPFLRISTSGLLVLPVQQHKWKPQSGALFKTHVASEV